MALTQTDAELPDSDQIDRLSSLPDALLATIIWLLPTRMAARTMVLSSRYSNFWKNSLSLKLIYRDMAKPQSKNFLAMTDCLLLSRDDGDAHPLLSLHLDISAAAAGCTEFHTPALLAKVCSFSLQHLSIEGCSNRYLLFALPAIFSMKSLESLSLEINAFIPPCYPESKKEFALPSVISLTRLRTLFLDLFEVDFTQFHRLISKLPSLEDLSVKVSVMEKLSISSGTIRKLKLVIIASHPELDTVVLSLPSLELLHIENELVHNELTWKFQGDLPLLRKVVVNFDYLQKDDNKAVAGLLNYISHVEELTLHIKEYEFEKKPFPILLEPGKGAPDFPNLKHLEATMCFHERNFEDIVSVLYHSPALETLKLVHETPCSDTFGRKLRKRKQWESKLTQNAYFTNLHLGENDEQYGMLLNKKSTPKSL